MKHSVIFLLFLVAASTLFAQKEQQPKLVVGIVIDQMREDYLTRFSYHYSEDGFKKLMKEGYVFNNMHFNYAPTYTGPGHASIFTGATPYNHGIIANDWYDRNLQKEVYCAGDPDYTTVGSESKNGKMSPHRLLSSTIADQISLSQQFDNRSFGISIKDRGAIFPAGHSGQAYWYDKKTGDFITSTFYQKQLPDWVQTFNQDKKASAYMQKVWHPLHPLKSYTASGKDLLPYEAGYEENKPQFPYRLGNLEKPFEALPATPFGNSLLKDFALQLLRNTDIGRSKSNDFLSISFSSTDYVGHQFGPNSKELQDTYVRLDRDIAAIIAELDSTIGRDNYVLFLTADHAAADVPQYLKDHNIPAGTFHKNVRPELEAKMDEKYGAEDWIQSISNKQVFLNPEACTMKKVSPKKARKFIAQHLLQYDGISKTYTTEQMKYLPYAAQGLTGLLKKGYNQQRSGDVLIVFEPGWFASTYDKGTTHGSAYPYDTHVPMIWLGSEIPTGKNFEKQSITSIAPTLSFLLDITLPNSSFAAPLEEILPE